jgi:hypothetical protein
VLYQGEHRQATVYAYAPAAKLNLGRARAVLQGAKNELAERVAQ